MPIMTVRCHVIGVSVTRITDLEGRVIRVICPRYDDQSGACRVKQEAQRGGPLSQLLDRVAEDALMERGTGCVLLVA